MIWPCLVRKEFCKTDISLDLEQEGVNEYGEPLEVFHYEGKCNYQDSAKRILTDQKKIVQITGVAMFPGDICPELPVISGGEAFVYVEELETYPSEALFPGDVLPGTKRVCSSRRICQARKARNPDGTVNYTEVFLE